jgi:hypothetical protein
MSIHPLVFNGISRLCNPDARCGAEKKKGQPVLPWLLLLEACRPDALETEKDKKQYSSRVTGGQSRVGSRLEALLELACGNRIAIKNYERSRPRELPPPLPLRAW